MAPTKRKRRSTKHRGNTAGMVESRGRTGRRPLEAEKRSGSGSGAGSGAADARARRMERANRPPTWRSATTRGLAAALFLFALSILVLKTPVVQALLLLPVILLIYIPMGYYLELFLHRRRTRPKPR